METLVIHTEDAAQSKTIKAFLKALNVRVEVIPQEFSVVAEELPTYIKKLITKSVGEADGGLLTAHEDFMTEVKANLRK